MVTQMLTQWLAAYSPVCHFQQVRFERAEMNYSQASSWFFTHSHTKHISQANLLRSGIFWSFKRAQNMTHFWAWLNRWPIVKFLKTQESTINRNNHDEDSCCLIWNIMGNISTSFTIPSPRTTCHRALSWTARKLRLRNFEMTDNNRSLIRTTIVLDRARFPADTLRQQLRDRLDEQPGTMAVSWTNRDEITTALSMTIQRV